MTIRKIIEKDREKVIDMMRVFYNSPAVYTNGSDEIFESDIAECIKGEFLDGYVGEVGGKIIGYCMLAKSFSTEFGKKCVWIEDIFILDGYRKKGYGEELFRFILSKYDNCIFRLEAEKENERAIKLYEKCGFSYLPYLELKK